MSRDKILAKLARMSAACLRANGLTQPPAVDMSHDPHDVTPAKPTLRQKRGPKLNKTEAAFEAYLRANTERTIHTQDITLTLGNGVRYTPDFSTWSHLHGQIPCFYEVKGFMRDDAAVKLKVAAAKFQHFNFYLVFRDRTQTSGWRIEEVLP